VLFLLIITLHHGTCRPQDVTMENLFYFYPKIYFLYFQKEVGNQMIKSKYFQKFGKILGHFDTIICLSLIN